MNYRYLIKILQLYVLIFLLMITMRCGLIAPTESDTDIKSWRAINSGIESKTIQAIATVPGSPHIVYAGSMEGVYKTINRGENWSAINSGLTSHDIKALVVHPVETNIIYCGTWGEGVFRSDDGGTSWNHLSKNSIDPRIQALAVDDNNSDCIWAATNEGLYRSLDGGGNWIRSYQSGNILSVAVKPGDAETVYIGIEHHGSKKTENGGQNWKNINNGLFKSGSLYASPNSYSFDPQNPEHVFISTGWIDIYVTQNGGSSWSQIGYEVQEKKVLGLAINPYDSRKIWAATESHGVWCSSDVGENWSEHNDGLTTQNTRCISVASDGVIFVGTVGKGIFKYED